MEHEFGGPWTQTKLEALRAYLSAYEKIFTKEGSPASHFTRIYVDAFAGSGTILLPQNSADAHEGKQYLEGSASVALGLPQGFDQYIFIEKDPAHATKLRQLANQFKDKSSRVKIEVKDANDFLIEWCSKTDWKKCRALVFLDPYGMQLNWTTVEAIAKTKGIDLWLLFPLGQGVMRMLTNSGIPPKEWSEKLTRFFGSNEWEKEFYQESPQDSLFPDYESAMVKTATFDSIKRYFVKRLSSIFEGVANPMELRNSTGNPLFLLCFAASNPRGAPIAVRIANYILGEKQSGRK